MRKVIIINGILKCKATEIIGVTWRDIYIDLNKVVSIGESEDENQSVIYLLSGHTLIVNIDAYTLGEMWTDYKHKEK